MRGQSKRYLLLALHKSIHFEMYKVADQVEAARKVREARFGQF